MESIKNVILVLSGKGGVGKSTVATQIALGLVAKGKKVGLLDVDLCGPSIPRMLNLKGKDIYQCSEGWVPVYTDESKMLAVMSIGFLLGDQDDAVVWRGPKKNGMIKQFLTEVFWQDVDYLIIDTPPGTTDEHITVVETLRALKPLQAVVVTTPQNVATADVRRELTFCKKTKIRVLGIVENMSGFVCPNCENCTNVFSSGGGESLAAAVGVPFIGTLPLDPRLTKALEEGSNFLVSDEGSRTHESILKVVDALLATNPNESSQV